MPAKKLPVTDRRPLMLVAASIGPELEPLEFPLTVYLHKLDVIGPLLTWYRELVRARAGPNPE
jgi:hypothetical protein